MKINKYKLNATLKLPVYPVLSILLFTILSIFSIMSIFIFSGCMQTPETDISKSPTPMLYDSQDENEALYSGNYIYGSVLTSDGKNIYYCTPEGTLMRNALDENTPEVLSDKKPSSISYRSGKLFFKSGNSDSGGPIYKIDINGEGETMVTDELVSLLIPTEDKIFFINSADSNLYSINHDGSSKTLLIQEKIDYICYFDDKLYVHFDEYKNYVAVLDRKYTNDLIENNIPLDLARVRDDGILYDLGTDVCSLNISHNGFYYINSEKTGIYFQNFEGKSKRIAKIKLSKQFITNNGYFYYINENDSNRLYRGKLDSPDITELTVNDMVDRFAIIGNSVFYTRTNSASIYRTSIAGGRSEKLS